MSRSIVVIAVLGAAAAAAGTAAAAAASDAQPAFAIANDRLTVLFPKGAAGACLVPKGVEADGARILIGPAARGSEPRLAGVEIVENTEEEVAVDARFERAGGAPIVIRYSIETGARYVATEAREGAESLCVTATSRFAILPDFFADDIAIDAREIPVAEAELPGENFLLQPLAAGQLLLASIWEERGDDVRVRIAGEGDARAIERIEIPYGGRGRIWVAALAGRGIWHAEEVRDGDAGKERRLEWTRPFPAQWRIDWRTSEGETDTWEMMIEMPDGRFVKPDWFGQREATGTEDWLPGGGKRWSTELGMFRYPCWIAKDGRGHLLPLEKGIRFRGPAIIYPIDRVPQTPPEAFALVDAVRATLGVGPCQYILDVEGQQKISRGIPTCDARTKLNTIYERREQVQRIDDVRKTLDDVEAFVRSIRDRIEAYVEFGHKLREDLAARKRAQPDLAPFIDEMDAIARGIDAYVEKRKKGINTREYAAAIIAGFRKDLAGYAGADALDRCRAFGRAITTIGGAQDDLVAECRKAVRVLRQRAGLRMAVDAKVAPIAREIRDRAQAMLRSPVSYEAPRR